MHTVKERQGNRVTWCVCESNRPKCGLAHIVSKKDLFVCRKKYVAQRLSKNAQKTQKNRPIG
jgi:hypothetical protein